MMDEKENSGRISEKEMKEGEAGVSIL